MNRNTSVFDQMITKNKTVTFLLLSLFVLLGVDSAQAVPAFPGAEGYGAVATGGRGGVVYEVTNLNATGTGSLGAAISASGARTVVFRVSGTITGNFNIKNGNITIAGQTAPGDGICIKGTLGISADNVIVRYIRVRNDTSVNPESDTIGGRGHQNIIIDHVSASWSGDEVMSFYQNTNVTIQWCMITEACAKFIDGVNTGHQFGGIWGNNYGTYHHNLIAHNVSRNMRWASGCKYNDYRNNVIYNWDYASCYGGEAYQDATWNFSTINMIANYYKPGPATDSGVQDRIAEPSERAVPPTPDPDGDGTDKGSWYVSDNYVHGYPAVTANNWLGMDGSSYIALSAPWPAMPINQQTPQDAYNAVLASVGCSKPNRDSVDATIIQDVTDGTATWGNNGILTYPTDAGGGWPTLASGTPPVDNDHDGMPDDWETDNGLNPSSSADRNYYTLSSDYTNLEVYLDSLVNVLDETAPTPDPMIWATAPYGANETSVTMVASTASDNSGVEYYFACTSGGGHDSGWQNSPVYTDTGLTLGVTYSYRVKARDKSTNQNETEWSGIGSAVPVVDGVAPTPNPMTWATNPYAVNPSSIAMVATTAADTSGVEYYFACIAGSGHDSGWQDSTSYTDTGLAAGVISYQVKARDKSANQNETGWSAVRSVTLVPDTAAPVPNPMTWASAPAAIGIDTVTMTATTATDASGVEYYFACTSGGGHDSDWQDGTTYTDTGLTNNTTYAYRVIARDKSAGQYETGWSEQASATTLRYECLDPVENDFNGDCRVDFEDYAIFASVWVAEPGEFVNLVVNGDFATGLSGWNTALANPTLVEITWDAGTAKLARTVSNSTAPNGNYLYQVIPVVSGKEYELDAQWKGDLTGTDRQWAEVYVGFVATGTIPPSAFGSIMYKKATYGGPNANPMPWDWESILLSPNTSPVPPAGGLFTATDNYMVIAFNIGGRASAGTCYYSVDNISVVEAGGTPCPTIDLNDDCQLDFQDLEVFAADWLDCNRNPSSQCEL